MTDRWLTKRREDITTHILNLDNWTCRGCDRRTFLHPPHHIIYKSKISVKDGRDEDWNLITLCVDCHYEVHHGKGKHEDRISGRRVMLNILKKLEDVVGFRWGKSYQMLRRKV